MLTHPMRQPAVDQAALRQCARKLHYPTLVHARAAAMAMEWWHREEFTAYRCQGCGDGYLIGHRYPLPRKRSRSQA